MHLAVIMFVIRTRHKERERKNESVRERERERERSGQAGLAGEQTFAPGFCATF